MAKPRLITLTTDFGMSDPYVGIMKGVISRVNTKLRIIDLSHGISAQNIREAGFVLSDAFPYFPRGTVHLAVVDPGVGSQRRAVAVKTKEAFFVGPDNGLFTKALQKSPPLFAVELNDPKFWRTSNPSCTFHGRDIFAPVAAHLANGTAIEKCGKPVDLGSLTKLDLPGYIEKNGSIEGIIERSDRFGNLISNIPQSVVNKKSGIVQLGQHSISLVKTYADKAPGTVIALIGSHDCIEIAVVNGNARADLKVHPGDPVKFTPTFECLSTK